MVDIATPEFLAKLKDLYPAPNPWWILVLSAFSTGNRPDAVPLLFQSVLSELERAQEKFNVTGEEAHAEKLTLARKFRDTILKSGMLSGYSKAINSLNSLHKIMPKELQDTRPLRDTSVTTDEYEKRGQEFFKALYGDTAEGVQSLLDSIMPDMGKNAFKLVAYGCVYGFLEYTDQLETSYTLVGSLIAGDTPLQINWHLNNARRGGATLDQARAAREIAIEAARSTGVIWKNQIPEVN
ncbi:hypothetical protein K488DRAFT_50091 [Vararia minispora EC-137]|uniref:Uncharacterized protein n=1 Tax=Vararia minispora EC-137 TaxID=1314806 RepID=A0ACB8QKV9_9AGAM|nr:hypothetical protein K488DRAFT_50091 [Vararia minispora EC-137]